MKEDKSIFCFLCPDFYFKSGHFYGGIFMNIKKMNIKGISVTAVCGALGFVLMLLDFPLPFIIPSFIKFDFSEIPALIVSFAYGPLYGILVCLIKNLLHLPMTSTIGVGELSNFILGAVFVGISGFFYKKSHNRKGALIGSAIGAISMAVISLFTNYFIVYPIYAKLFIPMDVIISMYKDLLPFTDTLWEALFIFNLPFNFVKGAIDTLVCFLIYKKLSPILKN